jgi:magnesium chelatase subunit D
MRAREGFAAGPSDPWSPAGPADEGAAELARVAAILAADPTGMGGAWLRGPLGPERDSFLELLRALSPERPFRKVPAGTPPSRLFGGLDLTATLRSGRPSFLPGLLAEVHGGWLAVPDAEGLAPELWGPLLAVLDRGEVTSEQGGFSRTDPARFGIVAMDELRDEPVGTAPGLLDRLGFWVEVPARQLVPAHLWSADDVAEAARGSGAVDVPEEALRALVSAAVAVGVFSMRVPAFAVRAARLSAALRGSEAVTEEDVLFAVRTVLAPRGAPMAMPEEEPDEAPEEPPPPERDRDPADPPEDRDTDPPDPGEEGRMPDRVVEAARAALPEIPVKPSAAAGRGGRGAGGRKVERIRAPARRGRVKAVRPGDPRDGRPLDVLATVRAAAPWQRLREREAAAREETEQERVEGGVRPPDASVRSPDGDVPPPDAGVSSLDAGVPPPDAGVRTPDTDTAREDAPPRRRLRIRPEDLRVRHLEAPRVVSTVFVVDGSGSHAARRLAEAKGAVELLLAGSYVRREQVGLVIFRNRSAEVALPLTRSLARARRVLAGLPGGGGTPVAAGLDLGLRLALDAERSGSRPRMVVLTDGKANVDLQGRGGRSRALDDAIRVARSVGAAGIEMVVLDTSPRGQDNTERIAEAAGGSRVRLPVADARVVHRTLAAVEEEGGR